MKKIKELINKMSERLDKPTKNDTFASLYCAMDRICNQLEHALEKHEADKKPTQIELCYKDKNYPFNRESLEIVDYGYSDNIYIVSSDFIDKIIAENEKQELDSKRLDWIDEIRPQIQTMGNGTFVIESMNKVFRVEADNMRDLIDKAKG